MELDAKPSQATADETPAPINSAQSELPIHEYVGGSSLRRYLNINLTKPLLEGLKKVSSEKPQDPLRWLGEYLIKKADERDEAEKNNASEEKSNGVH